MNNEITILLLSAFSIGFVHTLLGPDHYIPFIALSKARKWTPFKTIIVTTFCGVGHVLSAAALGFVGVFIGFTAAQLKFIESFRGEIAAWFLISFGLIYFIWGVRAAIRNKRHTHIHVHGDDGHVHAHEHSHTEEHVHVHLHKNKKELTPWILFIVFILGPCEPLIPLIMYPAIKGNLLSVFLVVLVFGLATIITMLLAVIASIHGLRIVKFKFLERYGSATAGAIICSLGLGIKFLGM